jgi:hypothetical protein
LYRGPTVDARDVVVGGANEGEQALRRVVAQVEFERHMLKPGLIFKGKGLKPVAFKLWVNRVQLAPPHRRVLAEHAAPG